MANPRRLCTPVDSSYAYNAATCTSDCLSTCPKRPSGLSVSTDPQMGTWNHVCSPPAREPSKGLGTYPIQWGAGALPQKFLDRNPGGPRVTGGAVGAKMTSLKNATRTALSPLGDEARISGTPGLGGGFCSRLPFRIATSVRLTGTPSENEMPATEPEGSVLAASRDKSDGILSGLRGHKNLITPSLAKLGQALPAHVAA